MPAGGAGPRLAALAERALTDPLTGIPNRRALTESLSRTLARTRRGGGSGNVQAAFIDLDDFKAINDRLGHDVGDRFLEQVGERLSAATRHSEVVARYGGDEFVLVAEGARPDELKERLERVIRGRYDLGDEALDYGGASVGVVTAGTDETADALLKRADASMYEMKRARKTAW